MTDVNKDGQPDLLVGKTTGALHYWKNSGPEGSLVFTLEDESFLELGSTVLRQNIACSVSDFNGDGKSDLIYGDQKGQLNIISNFREASSVADAITDLTFNPLSGIYESRNLGGRIWPTSVNLFGTTKPAIVVGNVLGGLTILRHDEGESLPETPEIEIYPNPVAWDAALTIKIDRPAEVQIFSMVGQALTEPAYLAGNEDYTYALRYLASGVYIFRFTTNGKSFAKRIVIF